MSDDAERHILTSKDDKAGVFYAATLHTTGKAANLDWSLVRRAEPISFSRADEAWVDSASHSAHESIAEKQASASDTAPHSEWAGKGIGYKLLRKAGYKGSGGLGAQEQGTVRPLKAWKQSGKAGIGVKPAVLHETALVRAKTGSKSAPGSFQADVKRGRSTLSKEEAEEANSRAQMKRKWPRVTVEEDLDSKLKRWRQVLQAEADGKAGKEVDRYIFRLFRDDSALDTNPLMRYNNLSSNNPLL